MGVGDWDRLTGQVAAQLSYLPGVLLVVAIVGLLQRWSSLVWAGDAFVFFQVMLGETLRLPDGIDAISPFWHLPGLPVQAFDPLPTVIEFALTAALVLLGVWGYRRRDVTAG